MPELRKNLLTGEWVSIAEERAKRPTSFKGIGLGHNAGDKCPFCRGNENMTTAEVYRSDNGRVRIISNLYPVLTKESTCGFGIHDVVIDTDRHEEQLHEFSVDDLSEVFIGIRHRVKELKKDKNIRYIQVFKNQGALAGASQPHSHWQIVALPIIPLMQRNIYKNSYNYYAETGKCYICDEIIRKSNCGTIYENSLFKAFCNHASKFCYETHITPKYHCSNFENLDDKQATELAEVLKKSLTALNAVYKDLNYNICLMNSLVNSRGLDNLDDCMHYYIQIIPRTGHLAGFEFATHSYINSIPPEKAAKTLSNLI